MHYSFSQLAAGTSVRILTTDGDSILFTSRGQVRNWLDCTINGEAGVLLCYYLPFDGDFEHFREQLQAGGGAVQSATPAIESGMTAVFMIGGSNYPVAVEDVQMI